MSNIYPSQLRTVDPYESYGSNIVNRLTRIVSREVDIFMSPSNIDVIIDSTSPTCCVVMTEGMCLKNDVLLKINNDFSIDMSDIAFYVDITGGVWNEEGYYYIILDYKYVKAKPAPKAAAKLLKPSQRWMYLTTSRYMFVKAVEVRLIGMTYTIVNLFDYDPDNLDVKRRYPKFYNYIVDNGGLPSDEESEQGDIIFYNGYVWIYANGNWEILVTTRDIQDTTSCSAGQLGYLDKTSETVKPAIATSYTTQANCVVLNSGHKDTFEGVVILVGIHKDVQVESGISILFGETLYLSESDAGCVTNVEPTISQKVGYAVSDSTAGLVDIWFLPEWAEPPALSPLFYGGMTSISGETPTVTNYGIVTTSNGVATNITNFITTNPYQGLVVIFGDNNTTIIHNGAKIILQGGADFKGNTNDTITFVYNGSIWFEISRSLN